MLFLNILDCKFVLQSSGQSWPSCHIFVIYSLTCVTSHFSHQSFVFLFQWEWTKREHFKYLQYKRVFFPTRFPPFAKCIMTWMFYSTWVSLERHQLQGFFFFVKHKKLPAGWIRLGLVVSPPYAYLTSHIFQTADSHFLCISSGF